MTLLPPKRRGRNGRSRSDPGGAQVRRPSFSSLAHRPSVLWPDRIEDKVVFPIVRPEVSSRVVDDSIGAQAFETGTLCR